MVVLLLFSFLSLLAALEFVPMARPPPSLLFKTLYGFHTCFRVGIVQAELGISRLHEGGSVERREGESDSNHSSNLSLVSCLSWAATSMASTTPDGDNKRRRTASPIDDDGSALSIYTLHRENLRAIADYLPQTSRALFAVALTSISEAFVHGQQPNEASKAVIASANEGWETLDFADVGDLAARLNDNDVHALLFVIDAKNKLKKLWLTGCNNIVGHGLEPLRQSVVLEHISTPLPLDRMSTAVVTSILVDKRKCLIHCCDQPASMVCFQCLKGSCQDCNNDYEPILSCSHCNLTFCECHMGAECDSCNTFYCQDCTGNDEVGSAKNLAKKCMYCNECWCTDCWTRICTSDGGPHCPVCPRLHVPILARQLAKVTERNQELAEEVEGLRKKMSGLGISA